MPALSGAGFVRPERRVALLTVHKTIRAPRKRVARYIRVDAGVGCGYVHVARPLMPDYVIEVNASDQEVGREEKLQARVGPMP